MSVLSSISRFFGSSAPLANGTYSPPQQQLLRTLKPSELAPRDLYTFLKAAYLTNGFYDEVRASWATLGYTPASIKAIRSVVAPVVDILGSKLYPEPLTVTTATTQGITSQVEREEAEANDPLKAAIDLVHTWSNWGRAKRKHARWVALYGEAFLQVVADPDAGRVYFNLIEPQYVTDYTLDVRDYLTDCRIDIPQCTETQNGRRHWTHTEYWDTLTQTVRYWATDGDATPRRLEDLGAPVAEIPLAAFGIDFVPIVRTPFREIDDGRAIGAVQLAVEAIIEADLSATNLHSMVYTDAEGAWVLKAVGLDANNRPLPPPVVGAATADGQNGRQSDNTVQVGKRSFWRLGGNQELQSVIPDIDYAGALAILKDHDEHLERLMPALSYARLSELSGGDLSGKAITYKMRAFVDQVEEGRSNVLASLKQADMMALTMGQAAGIPEFQGLGTFDQGSFEHDFQETDILHISSLDEAEEKRARAQAAQALAGAGIPMSVILTDTLEMSEQEATEIVDEAAEEAEQAFEQQQALAAAQPAPGDSDAA